MKINVSYDSYNTNITEATIPLENDQSLVVVVNDKIGPDNDVKHVVIKTIDAASNEVELKMIGSEMKEFISLLNKALTQVTKY